MINLNSQKEYNANKYPSPKRINKFPSPLLSTRTVGGSKGENGKLKSGTSLINCIDFIRWKKSNTKH